MTDHDTAADAAHARVERCVIDAIIRFGADAASVTPSASLAALDTDLLDILALSQVVHEEFGVRIRTRDAIALDTVADAIDLVAGRMRSGTPPTAPGITGGRDGSSTA